MLRMFRQLEEKRQNDESGFTLIELLVVIIIIGILAAIAIPVFLNQRERAWRSAVQSDLRNAAIAMETYGTDNNGSYNVTTPEELQGFGLQTSTDVILRIYSGGTGDTAYCMEGDHARLDAADVPHFVFDPRTGGLSDYSPDDACTAQDEFDAPPNVTVGS